MEPRDDSLFQDILKILDFPTLEDGAHGVKFIEAWVESAENNGSWVNSKLHD